MLSFWKFSKDQTTEGQVTKDFLGGKGAGLVEMTRAGVPVPPGFVIPVDVCHEFYVANQNHSIVAAIALRATAEVKEFLTQQMGHQPLVSVRSGARVSMPGMMDTILNVGMTEEILPFWSKKLGARTAFDLYRRLIGTYGTVVFGIKPEKFQTALKAVMASKYDSKPALTEADMSLTHMNKLCQRYLKVCENEGFEFPQTLEGQLMGALGAVFKSWNSERAIAYRIKNQIPHDWYTACVVQAMVFGNANEQSCSGVLFSRDPSTGEGNWKGEFLPNAQGEEVVSGTSTPLPLTQFAAWNQALKTELNNLTVQIEKTYKDMVDIEFTVESGKFYILQARVGKRTASAAFQIAYDLVKEGVISKDEALKRLTVDQYKILAVPSIDPSYKGAPDAIGLAGSKGIATGKLWLTSEKAIANPGGILVTKETTPNDYAGMLASVGILTSTGGITSHAALTARSEGKVCVVGCTSMEVQSGVNAGIVFHKVGGGTHTIPEGIEITIDGSTGNVYVGAVPTIGGKIPAYVQEMIEWGVKSDMVFQYDALTDTLPESGEVYISLTKLKEGQAIRDLIDFLNIHRKNLRGILTLKDAASLFDDSNFLSPMGLTTFQHTIHPNQIEGLKALGNAEVAANWTVLGLEGSHLHGIKIHNKIKTLKEFMEADGYYELDPLVEKVLKGQGTTVQEFVDLLQKSGKSLKPIAIPTSRAQLAFKVLGK